MMEDTQHELRAKIAGGESQALEFKEKLPPQMRDLAKELAAFATSNDGELIVGVSDGGSIVGLGDLSDLKTRDELRNRVIGTCTHSIRPPVTPAVEFIEIDSHWLMSIQVHKGTAPLYYVNNVPMLRHLTSSRPAEPQEVIDKVLSWKDAASKPPSEEDQFLSAIAGLLNNVLVSASEVEFRDCTPWLESLRYDFEASARQARSLLLEVPAAFDGLPAQLEAMAEQLDSAAHERLGLNFGWAEYRTAAREAANIASAIRTERFGDRLATPSNIAFVEKAFHDAVAALRQLGSRADGLAYRRTDELKSEAAERGLELLRAVTYGIGFRDDATRAEIAKQARRLREVETRTIYMDGGKSIDDIVATVKDGAAQLTTIEASLDH